MIRRLPAFLAWLLLLAMLGQSAQVLARASAEYDRPEGLTRLIQLDLCSHQPAQPDPNTLPVSCEHCLTQCCAAFLPRPPATLAPRRALTGLVAPPVFSSPLPSPVSWQRPYVRAPPALA